MLVFPVYFLKSFAYAGIGVVLISMTTGRLRDVSVTCCDETVQLIVRSLTKEVNRTIQARGTGNKPTHPH